MHYLPSQIAHKVAYAGAFNSCVIYTHSQNDLISAKLTGLQLPKIVKNQARLILTYALTITSRTLKRT